MRYNFMANLLLLVVISVIFECCVWHKIGWFKEHGSIVRKGAAGLEKILTIILWCIETSVITMFIYNIEFILKRNIFTVSFFIVNIVLSLMIVYTFYASNRFALKEEACKVSRGRWLLIFVDVLLTLISVNALYEFMFK